MNEATSIKLQAGLESKILPDGRYMLRCIKCQDFLSYDDLIKTGICPKCGKDLTDKARKEGILHEENLASDESRRERKEMKNTPAETLHENCFSDKQLKLFERYLARELQKSSCSAVVFMNLGLFLWWLGSHQFYIGNYGRGAAHVVASVLIFLVWLTHGPEDIMWLIAIAQAICAIVSITVRKTDGIGNELK